MEIRWIPARARPGPLRARALVRTNRRRSRARRADPVDADGEVPARPRAALPALRAGHGANAVEGIELLGHTGFIGAFAFHAPGYDAVLAGTHNASEVDRWPLVAALCRELRQAAR
jgi:hypothetical protein